ncbi:hypothetical protein PUN28_003629 [Cardiocondyla obscurior]|uniref:Uncharacterized protein n=1 Tax=Cardiocondyla obscurior TaxID=286306 RepID=A0AAW2GNI8_9HYME
MSSMLRGVLIMREARKAWTTDEETNFWMARRKDKCLEWEATRLPPALRLFLLSKVFRFSWRRSRARTEPDRPPKQSGQTSAQAAPDTPHIVCRTTTDPAIARATELRVEVPPLSSRRLYKPSSRQSKYLVRFRSSTRTHPPDPKALGAPEASRILSVLGVPESNPGALGESSAALSAPKVEHISVSLAINGLPSARPNSRSPSRCTSLGSAQILAPAGLTPANPRHSRKIYLVSSIYLFACEFHSPNSASFRSVKLVPTRDGC